MAVGSSFQRERQAQREDALELTEKLDRDWRGIHGLLARRAPQSQDRGRKEQPQVGLGQQKHTGLTSAGLTFLRRKGGGPVSWSPFLLGPEFLLMFSQVV